MSNGNYSLKASIAATKAKVLVVVGEKEISIMRKSAQKLHEVISGKELYMAQNLKHGELSIAYPQEYADILKQFVEKST